MQDAVEFRDRCTGEGAEHDLATTDLQRRQPIHRLGGIRQRRAPKGLGWLIYRRGKADVFGESDRFQSAERSGRFFMHQSGRGAGYEIRQATVTLEKPGPPRASPRILYRRYPT